MLVCIVLAWLVLCVLVWFAVVGVACCVLLFLFSVRCFVVCCCLRLLLLSLCVVHDVALLLFVIDCRWLLVWLLCDVASTLFVAVGASWCSLFLCMMLSLLLPVGHYCLLKL